MSLEFLSRFLLWMLVVNYAILFTWFLAFVLARGFMRKLHGRWFDLSERAFDAIHYGGMAAYKIAIFVFNLVPLVALWIMRAGN